jgi:hypothetical protein
MFAYGCEKKQNINPSTPPGETMAKPHDEGNTAIHSGPQLNNGQKWEANPETKEGIKEMKNLVNVFNARTPHDAVALHDSLEKTFTVLLQKCTMSGEAHEQLHAYLEPLHEMIGQLNEGDGSGTARKIESYLGEFEKYFQ